MTKIEDAISQSAATDTIVRISGDLTEMALLKSKAENWITLSDVVDAWGETDDGEEWRVIFFIE